MKITLVLLALLPSILTPTTTDAPLARASNTASWRDDWSPWSALADGLHHKVEVRTCTGTNSLMKSGYCSKLELRAGYTTRAHITISVWTEAGVKGTWKWILDSDETVILCFDTPRLAKIQVDALRVE